VRQCNGVCNRDKVKLIKKPIYVFQDYCAECEVYYPKNSHRICPCCKCMVRVSGVKSEWKRKHLNRGESIVEHGDLPVSVIHSD
jgi:hypothetical protein